MFGVCRAQGKLQLQLSLWAGQKILELDGLDIFREQALKLQ